MTISKISSLLTKISPGYPQDGDSNEHFWDWHLAPGDGDNTQLQLMTAKRPKGARSALHPGLNAPEQVDQHRSHPA